LTRIALLSASAVLGLVAQPVAAQQASLVVSGSANTTYQRRYNWELTKQVKSVAVQNGAGTVTWTVAAIRTTGPTTFSVGGNLRITNGGSAPATLGNIVVNLQRANKVKIGGKNVPWVSVAACVANASAGSAATSASILAAASQENAAGNAAIGPGNYTVSGPVGTFTETPGSGALEFKDADNNSLFSLVPQPSLAAGATVDLEYEAEFDSTALPSVGTGLRVELLVTFGNAGRRGGGGASAGSVDIDGDGAVDPDEANIRTVPARAEVGATPGVANEAYATATVADLLPGALATTGSVTLTNPVGFGSGLISGSTWFDVAVDVQATTNGATVRNTVTLTSPGVGDLPPLNLNASATAELGLVGGFRDNDYCVYTNAGFGVGGAQAPLLAEHFATLFPEGMEIGVPGEDGFSVLLDSVAAVQAFLATTGAPGPLVNDQFNPTSSSAGSLGSQIATLKLNVALGDQGITPGDFGDLYYVKPGDALHGRKVRSILRLAEIALGTNELPDDHTFATLLELLENLNTRTFQNCQVGPFSSFLSRFPPDPRIP
jgi:hypothetical protein